MKLPAGIMPASASLEVSTDPDGVAGLEEGLRDLIEYPYGCLEQTTSRLIPLVAVEELAKSLKLAGLDGPALQKFIRAGLGKLEKFQTDEGGFSLWVGGKAEPYLTAFALWGLKLASDAGHKLPPGMIDRGTQYLRAQLGRDANVAGRRAQRARRAREPRLRGARAGHARQPGPRATPTSCSRRRRSCRASARRSWRARWR